VQNLHKFAWICICTFMQILPARTGAHVRRVFYTRCTRTLVAVHASCTRLYARPSRTSHATSTGTTSAVSRQVACSRSRQSPHDTAVSPCLQSPPSVPHAPRQQVRRHVPSHRDDNRMATCGDATGPPLGPAGLYRRGRAIVYRGLIHDLLFLPISTIESAVGKRLITHCCILRLACSRLSEHIEPHSPRLQA